MLVNDAVISQKHGDDPPLQEKCSGNAYAILKKFLAIPLAALRLHKLIPRMDDPTLRMASHGLEQCENHSSQSRSQPHSRNR